MKKYEEMLQNLSEENRNIVLEAMQHHDKHYQAMVSWSKREIVRFVAMKSNPGQGNYLFGKMELCYFFVK